MNRVYLTIAIALLTIFLPVLAAAQPGSAECDLGYGPMARGMMHRAGRGPKANPVAMVLRLKDQLSLTAEQTEKLQAIKNELQGRCEAGFEALKAKKDALYQAAKAGAPETEIRAAATQLANAIADKAVLMAAVKAKVDAVLTDAQKTKLKELKEQRKAQREKWRAEGGRGMRKGRKGPKGRWTKDPQEKFKRIDTNSDGSISLEEFTAHTEKMKARFRERRQGRWHAPSPE